MNLGASNHGFYGIIYDICEGLSYPYSQSTPSRAIKGHQFSLHGEILKEREFWHVDQLHTILALDNKPLEIYSNLQ